SPLTLAAFRPWGSSQDARRAGSIGKCRGRTARRAPPPSQGRKSVVRPARLVTMAGHSLCFPTEDSPSGLWRSPGTRVGLTPSGVQIPYPPPQEPPWDAKAARGGFLHPVDSGVAADPEL